jgi:ATP-dependent helicase/nuclease subunit A
MSGIQFTPEQRRAIETVGRSLIVSAAAGSGKTAVLAARCAYLICDAEPPYRCDADQLLVLTFTEAAAAEMRGRIVEVLRDRAEREPHNERLMQQVSLVEAAQISTIHSFCLWLIRRWFSEIGLDPAAGILDEDEARMIRREVIDGLFMDLYEQAKATDGNVLGGSSGGAKQAERGRANSEVVASNGDTLARRFVALVDDYGLGDDSALSSFVLKLSSFAGSLPDSEEWLNDAVKVLAERPSAVVEEFLDGLRWELAAQIERCEALAAKLFAGAPVGHHYAKQVKAYAEQLTRWLALAPDHAGQAPGATPAADINQIALWDQLLEEIRSFEFSKSPGPRLSRQTDSAIRAARDEASRAFSDLKKTLFYKRLYETYASNACCDWLAGLQRIAPYTQTIVDLARAFSRAYADRKRELNVIDFADFERFAFSLLHDPGDKTRPSQVARVLHRRFGHVLVDEFQDVNPIQQAILHLVSRESDPDAEGNLFVVGDVRQSIYRFRLAEPALFSDRLDRFRAGNGGAAITLQHNFRSRPEVLDAVNLLFRGLMRRELGDIVYDSEAELRPGLSFPEQTERVPVELHLLEGNVTSASDSTGLDENNEGDGDESSGDGGWGDDSKRSGVDPAARGVDLDDPARWQSIEREAYLIGCKIRDWVASGEPMADGRPMRYRDAAVLLRVTKINAERVAAMLNRMGVPAFAAASGSLFATLEVRDVMAALELLDNAQQDIPLAAVMRSGVFGVTFTEDEMIEMRCQRRGTFYHRSVREYLERGSDMSLRDRLATLISRIERFRDAARRLPLADVLWMLYEEHGYLAYACGLPNGIQRRANLLKLHELARSFGTFRRQGLRRFLRFIKSLEDNEQDLAVAPAIGESENVVRVMSIHQAKGLEFPVVFVAGLGTKFNLGDRSGRMIFERQSRIGLREVDANRYLEFPTAAHRLVVAEVERNARAEELRILYVAMTRARDRLILIGSERNMAKRREAMSRGAALTKPSVLELAGAQRPLDWIVPVLANAEDGKVLLIENKSAAPSPSNAVFTISWHEPSDMAQWQLSDARTTQHKAILRSLAQGGALPDDEPLAPHDADVDRVLKRIEFVYPYLSVATVPVTMAAGAFKGAFDYLQPEGEWSITPRRSGDVATSHDSFAIPPSRYAPRAADDALGRGLLMHRVLQHLDFSVAKDQAKVACELDRLVRAEILRESDRGSIDTEALGWLVASPIGKEIRAAGGDYRRELHFIAAEPPNFFDRHVVPGKGDFVLVRGIVDAVWPGADGMEVVDFKTDAVADVEATARAERYRPQLILYARAVERLYRRRVARCRLVFLHPRTVVEVAPGAKSLG